MGNHNDLQGKKRAKMRVKKGMKSTASCVELCEQGSPFFGFWRSLSSIFLPWLITPLENKRHKKTKLDLPQPHLLYSCSPGYAIYWDMQGRVRA